MCITCDVIFMWYQKKLLKNVKIFGMMYHKKQYKKQDEVKISFECLRETQLDIQLSKSTVYL